MATQNMFALIGYAGLSDIKLIPSDQLEADLTGYHAVAEGNARLLVTHIISNSVGMSEIQLIENSIATKEKKYQGGFELHKRYVITPRVKGGYCFIGTRDDYVGEGGGAPKRPTDKFDDRTFQTVAINAFKSKSNLARFIAL